MKSVIAILCFLYTICGSSVSPHFEDLKSRNGSLESRQNDGFLKNYSKRNSAYDEFHNNRRYHNFDYDLNRLYRTYQRGQATVTRGGETVVIPDDSGKRRAVKIIDNRIPNDNRNNGRRNRSKCTECPTDQTVIATKGKDFVILPEPCPSNPKMWYQHSGPKPGTQIQEGVHVIRGTIGPKKRFCEYQYQVLVRRCTPIKVPEETTTIECSGNDVWGSQCIISCKYEKEPSNSAVVECMEDLQWSNEVPTCKGEMDCSMPKVKTKSKISCQTANMTKVEGDFIPNGSSCQFNKNGKQVSLNCKNGTWRLTRKIKKAKNKPELKKIENGCDPNPCQNGGTCLRSESSKDKPICKCQPYTQGAHCEMRECDYNICHNEGVCLFVNYERTCFCSPEYSGSQCQNQRNY